MNTTRANLNTLKDFMPTQQLAFMQRLTHGEEGEYFVNKFEEMANTVSTMPKTYETEGVAMDDKNIVLHYFYANLDWYIIEKDMEEGEPLSGGGYISIDEIINMRGVEIDLHWKPCTVAQLKAKRA